MVDNSFFAEQTEQSEVKARIVQKYFWAWANVMVAQKPKIAYIDLFAGPGRYESGKLSTPILILQQAIADEKIAAKLVTFFNDQDEKSAGALRRAIDSLEGLDKLQFKPTVQNAVVNENAVRFFEKTRLVPTFFFVDPWGYKGLSLGLINSVIKDWGCDCVFFFNYNRVNMGLSNAAVKSHMEGLFGESLTAELGKRLEVSSPAEREQLVVEGIGQAIRRYGARFVLPFCFKDAKGVRTSHHLFFITKHFKGYEIMKDIMAKESSNEEQGVPSFAYNPADKLPRQTLLFRLAAPLDDLEDMLLEAYAGKTKAMRAIYEEHSIDRPYIKPNYKEVLKSMESKGMVTVSDPLRKTRKKGTLADRLLIKFPKAKK